MNRAKITVTALVATVLVTVPVVRALAGSDARRTLPACARLGHAIARPAFVPAGFPVPQGTRFTEQTTSAAGTRIALGYAPLGLRPAAVWFRGHVQQAGYRTTSADAELAEAEAGVAADGVIGMWRVNEIRGCANAVVVTLAFAGRPAAAPARD
jgi:hypothetical protein